MRVRSCNFCLVLYPDNFEHQIAKDLLDRNGYQYTGILHNADVYDDDPNKLKKEHWHFVIVFPRQKDLPVLARELGVEERFLEVCRNRVSSERYLLHLDHPYKAQYSADELFGTLASSVKASVNTGETESEKVLSLLALLDDLPVPCTYRKFLVSACDAGLYSQFRRLGGSIKYLLDEHNGLAGY